MSFPAAQSGLVWVPVLKTDEEMFPVGLHSDPVDSGEPAVVSLYSHSWSQLDLPGIILEVKDR